MTAGKFIWRSLQFYWRTHLAVLAGIAVTTAILTGALAVGDSVRFSLRQQALLRLGRITHALHTGDRFFREKLGDETGTTPVLLRQGIATLPDGSARANDVQIAGVDERFWKLGATSSFTGLVVNARLAMQLGVKAGDTIVVRLESPAWLSHDAPLSGKAATTVAIRSQISAVAGDDEFGRFSLMANQVPPFTVFVPLAMLQQELKRTGQANVLLAAGSAPDLRAHWTLADAELVHSNNQLTTSRVFLDSDIPVAGAGVLTYFVNEIRHGDKATPYSFVTAVGVDEGVAINSWLAEDLGAKVGDELTFRYFVLGERRELVEQTAKFRVRAVEPTAKDDSWTPAFSGLADADNCRDWAPGIPLALDRIRSKDEAYWKDYRATPKAFISLPAGQKLWANRFGNLTAIRYPAGTDVAAQLKLMPPAFAPVRVQALRAAGESQDFGLLFLGFSIFLIVAALLLTGLLFVLNLEQRRAEIGLLRALGFSPGKVRWLMMGEAVLVALAGMSIGLAGGALYTKLTLYGLATVWRGAVGAAQFRYHAEPVTLVCGAVASLLAAFGALWLAQRHQTRQTPTQLLATTGGKLVIQSHARLGWWSCMVACAGAAAMVAVASDENNAEVFFGAGALLLIAGIGFSHQLLAWLDNRVAKSLASYGRRNTARRRGRSLTTVAVLASGVFLVVGVSVFRQDARREQLGTGGFVWYGQSALPVYEQIPGAVMLRLHAGDDASCRNLNHAQQPQLLGVRPEELAKRGAFGASWKLLEQLPADGAVPAIGDEATVTWALGKKVGDTLPVADARGRIFQVRIVGLAVNWILQGSLVLAEKSFVEHFPDDGGYRVFLMDSVPVLADKCLEVAPATRRLAEFLEVENTYLAIFQALGGLGVLLGSVGLAIVVARNTLERRGELAVLQAVGFQRSALRWLVVCEHWLLVILGIGIGLVAAMVAVLPSWRTASGAGIGPGMVALLAGLAVGGLGWSWLAAWAALRGPLLPALRNE